MSPWQAIQAAARPISDDADAGRCRTDPVLAVSWRRRRQSRWYSISLQSCMVRVWNPSRELQPQTADEATREVSELPTAVDARTAVAIHGAGGKVRAVWDNPVLWREIRTWAYGKRILVIRLAYWAVFLVCAAALVAQVSAGTAAR